MTLLVTFELFDTIFRKEDVERVRGLVGNHMKGVLGSGKVKASGVWADGRGGFILVDAASSDEVFGMLGGPILDHFTVRARPVVSFETLARFFQEHPVT